MSYGIDLIAAKAMLSSSSFERHTKFLYTDSCNDIEKVTGIASSLRLDVQNENILEIILLGT